MSAFRDLAARFADANAQVLGISTDDLATQKRFAESLKLPFPLLADSDGKVAGAYGVKWLGFASRVTFVIGKDGRIERVVDGKEALDPSSALSVCEAPPPNK
jgi:peroxiredoxin Q/BCP